MPGKVFACSVNSQFRASRLGMICDQSSLLPSRCSRYAAGSNPPTYPVARLQWPKFSSAPNCSYISRQLIKPGPSVSTISPSKSKTIAPRVLMFVEQNSEPQTWNPELEIPNAVPGSAPKTDL